MALLAQHRLTERQTAQIKIYNELKKLQKKKELSMLEWHYKGYLEMKLNAVKKKQFSNGDLYEWRAQRRKQIEEKYANRN